MTFKIKTIDLKNSNFCYVSVKYSEEQDKTFYYLSNIKDLKVGDCVLVPARDKEVPAIVDNIEIFEYKNVPYPLEQIKEIIKKIKVIYYKNAQNKYNEEDLSEFIEFVFEDEDSLEQRCTKLPYIKECKDKQEWIKEFYKLKLADRNYNVNFDYIEDKELEELTLKEVLTYITYLIRTEKHEKHYTTCYNPIELEDLDLKLKILTIEYIEITEETIKEIDKKNIIVVSYVPEDVLNFPPQIEIITKTGKDVKYYKSEFKKHDDIKLAYWAFPTLKNLKIGKHGIVLNVQKGFIHKDISLGKHLFIKEKIFEDFLQEIEGMLDIEIYMNWIFIILKLLKQKQ